MNQQEKKEPSVHWFPGHMAKTRRRLENDIKLVDIVIELTDARAPRSSSNPLLDSLIGNRLRIVALNKADLADGRATKMWAEYFCGIGRTALSIDSAKGKGVKELLSEAQRMTAEKTSSFVKKGGRARAARAMIVGIPNVGKSSLINRLAGAAKTKVENRPGVTRDNQWIKVSGSIELLDTPGILWPKFEDPVVGARLAFIGSVGEDAYDWHEISSLLLDFLCKNHPGRLMDRYNISAEEVALEPDEIFGLIAKRRGFLLKGGKTDDEKSCRVLLSDFRGGKLGRITLEKPGE